mgnify:CR=1 FL=1
METNDGDDRVESLWVRIKGKANKTGFLIRICYRQPNQDEEVRKTLYRQVGEVLRSIPLILIADLNSQTSARFIIQHKGNSPEGS